MAKGSFYHHFGSAAQIKEAMLEYFEAQYTTRLIDHIESEAATDRAKLQHLLLLVLADPDASSLEIAVRACALQDAEVRAAQERVDKARTAYLKKLCRGLDTDVDPDRFAQLLYLILIG